MVVVLVRAMLRVLVVLKAIARQERQAAGRSRSRTGKGRWRVLVKSGCQALDNLFRVFILIELRHEEKEKVRWRMAVAGLVKS